ncbi:hypothetical protein PM3016_5800 [Paenibacillus mucilaginosus 3016]|uniref:Uncharacterized protein n=2 Tax=Paenibacillus mucilaginosus TaxID=61624 RepID=H6NM60_9BACL|nr:hypothetical protein [Paenibacillus mucilaginosus]AFC32478.1 hypothetical protein PM3016_5800 [Paenibacillus mucilaginosus 3016]AFH64793.1 hypothetical protein B2K_29525 [Paenibacillus mucilaginosus K02]WFA20958.1 hypothetical protein ERY13_28820 [Paenibacillus mucilaginosus]
MRWDNGRRLIPVFPGSILGNKPPRQLLQPCLLLRVNDERLALADSPGPFQKSGLSFVPDKGNKYARLFLILYYTKTNKGDKIETSKNKTIQA